MKVLLTLVALLGAVCNAADLKPFGIVEGITNCGSQGELGPVHVPDCDVVPCYLDVGRVYDIQIYFTASSSSNLLNLFAYRIVDGRQVLLFLIPINGEIEAGKEYYLNFQLHASEDFIGQSDIVIYIVDMESEIIEVCASAPFIVRA